MMPQLHRQRRQALRQFKLASRRQQQRLCPPELQQGTAGLQGRPAWQGAGPQQYYSGACSRQHGNSQVYVGTALVVKGIINAMSGPRDEVWDDGMFEYVMSFSTLDLRPGGDPAGPPTPLVGVVDPQVPWIQDKTYSFTFYKHDRDRDDYY